MKRIATGINEVLKKIYDLNSITFTSREREQKCLSLYNIYVYFFSAVCKFVVLLELPLD